MVAGRAEYLTTPHDLVLTPSRGYNGPPIGTASIEAYTLPLSTNDPTTQETAKGISGTDASGLMD